MIFVMGMCCVFFEIGTEFVHIAYTIFVLQSIKGKFINEIPRKHFCPTDCLIEIVFMSCIFACDVASLHKHSIHYMKLLLNTYFRNVMNYLNLWSLLYYAFCWSIPTAHFAVLLCSVYAVRVHAAGIVLPGAPVFWEGSAQPPFSLFQVDCTRTVSRLSIWGSRDKASCRILSLSTMYR
jgi:hypothetical protein